jgi:hypothetical protein
MIRTTLASLLLLISFSRAGAYHEARQREQLHFSMEQEIRPVQRPVPLPDGLVKALGSDEFAQRVTRACLRASHLDEIPADWFIASEVHLGNPDERDFVILPKNPCLLGANVGPFWIARKTPGAIEIILSTEGHDLEILQTRSNGLRDIKIESATGTVLYTTSFRFDGKRYGISQTHSEPIS